VALYDVGAVFEGAVKVAVTAPTVVVDDARLKLVGLLSVLVSA
jgi:hypothetical protein